MDKIEVGTKKLFYVNHLNCNILFRQLRIGNSWRSIFRRWIASSTSGWSTERRTLKSEEKTTSSLTTTLRSTVLGQVSIFTTFQQRQQWQLSFQQFQKECCQRVPLSNFLFNNNSKNFCGRKFNNTPGLKI